MKQKNRQEQRNRINYQIRETEVRLVGDNVENKVVDIKTALNLSKSMELDLVEISKPKNNISICKIVDF